MEADERDPETVKLDHLTDIFISLTERMDRYVETQNQTGNHQTITYRSEGLGAWTAAAVTACFLTFLSLILYSAVVNKEMGKMEDQLRDLDAYRNLYGSQIDALKAQAKERK